MYYPYRVVKEIWQGSDPEAPLAGQAPRTTPALGLWWTCWIASELIGRLVDRLSSSAETIDAILAARWINLVVEVLTVIGAALVIYLVTQIDERQEQKSRSALLAIPSYPV